MIKKSRARVARPRGVTEGAFKILVEKVTDLAKTVEDDRKELLEKINALSAAVPEEKSFKINASPQTHEEIEGHREWKEWIKYVKDLLGEDFDAILQYTPTGMVSFSIIVPQRASNTKKEFLISGKDVRSKVFSPQNINSEIESFCSLVAKNLGIK